MAQHKAITRGGDAFLLKLRENMPLSDSMSEERFLLLIGISSIHSDRVILAMRDCLVSDHSRKDVCEKCQMNNGYSSTTLGRLTRLNVLVAGPTPYYTDSVSATAEAASLQNTGNKKRRGNT